MMRIVSGVRYVIDYAAMGRPGQARMLHRTDCPHPKSDVQYKAATPEQLRELPECSDCLRRDQS
jgi:hypothetical protein